jgi:hypothetical protein
MNENEIPDENEAPDGDETPGDAAPNDLLERALAERQFRQMILEYMQANTDALNGISAAIVSLGHRVDQIENDLRALRSLVASDSELPS